MEIIISFCPRYTFSTPGIIAPSPTPYVAWGVQVEPEQVPLVDDWYAAGYKAIVFSTDAYGTEVNLVAAEQYIGDESVKIVIEPAEINPAFQFSQDISNCKQTSVIVYIQAEILNNAESIEFLVKGES